MTRPVVAAAMPAACVRGARPGRRRTWAAGLAAARAAGAWGLAGPTRELPARQPAAEAAGTPFHRGRALAPTGAVRLFAAGGALIVEGWDRDSVDVQGTVSAGPGGAGAPPVAGGTATGWKLSTYDGDPEHVGPATLVVRVPRRAQVWAKTTTARLTARGLAGGVELYTITGAIDVAGHPATLTAESMRGDVRVAGTPGWVRARSGSGRVTFDGAAEDLALATVSGAITSSTRFARGRFESVSGRVALTGPLAAAAAADVDTHSGAVTLRLGPTVSAAFTVYSLTGQITNRLSATRPTTAGARGRELAFATGAGAARVAVRTFGGPVELRGVSAATP